MKIILSNPGTLSLIDLTTMGDSVKRGNAKKIGKFDSGLKYAISILYRNGITMEIYSNKIKYTFSSKINFDEETGKSKELLVVNEEHRIKHLVPVDVDKDRVEYTYQTKEHITAFSPKLGFEWKTWMAIRELYSNALDEGGNVSFFKDDQRYDFYRENETYIVIYDNDLLKEIIDNWNNYFLPSDLKPLTTLFDLKIYENSSKYLKLYKNGILVFEDKAVKTRYCYDYAEASIDEMRILNNKEDFTSEIVRTICSCKDKLFIQDFITYFEEDSFESKFGYYHNFSEVWIQTVNDEYNKSKQYPGVADLFVKLLKTNENLFNQLIENSKLDIGYAKVRKDSPSYWSTVEIKIVEKPKEEYIEPSTVSFEDHIKLICHDNGLEVTYPIVESEISVYKCMPDTYKEVIYVCKDFSEKDIWEMVKAQYRLKGKDNADYVYKKHAELLKSVGKL
jgi:hypothetical protein